MLSENRWKVIMLAAASFVAAEPSRALSVYQKPMAFPMFIPRNYRRKFKSRVMFLDEDENNQPLGRGEIDLTEKAHTKIKFDDTSDYEFTSPEKAEEPFKEEYPSGNERYYDLPRLRPFAYPKFYQGRFSRPYAPSFGFDPYQVPYAPPRTGFYGPNVPIVPNVGWKARSPRVVFPYSPDSGSGNSVQTNSHGGGGSNFNDNVVFRDQNFGNEIGTEDQGLQDISSGTDAFSERDANEPHRARYNDIKRMGLNKKKHESNYIKPMFIQTEMKIKRNHYVYPNASYESVLPEFKPISDAQMKKINEIINELRSTNKVQIQSTNDKRKGRILDNVPETNLLTENAKKDDAQVDKNCSQGGTCEFFFYCWMVGGLLDGSCGSLLKSCCHRVGRAGLLGVQDSNSIEYSANEGHSFGPVINDESCGVAVGKQTAQRRIVGGDDAGFGTFPWQAYIRIGSSRCNMLMSIFELIGWKQCWIERCGGSLISRRHVVTAGHCVARAQPRHVRVTLGDYVINSAAEPLPAYTFGVRSIKVHPLFKFTPQADRFDVAVLTLDRNVHYMPHIAPICLPERGSDFLGQYGWAAGWGALSPGSRLRPRTLQAVDVPVLDNRVCERWHRANGINVVIYPEMLCAGYRGGGKDSCQGDSGGPLMLERAGRWYLIGVVSAGYSCASRGQPGIYHRVAHTVDWISHATTLS
ncbi:coagulation factor VII isoform X1 [Vanessa cardui]|uniref:coagulation factor VII isoform X1 n=1 Tax=Vanessa cardui TaxID=171605 RepID=UPI001F13501D|nr:coagulation factor VII isoform X1 [Vanessa cardui]